MPKQSVSLQKNDFLQYLHLTQSEAAKLHNVSLSCFKRYFHQLFRPRIHWSTKKDRIILRKAINYPTTNIVSQELIDKFLSGTLRGDTEEEKTSNSELDKIILEQTKEMDETINLLDVYQSKQKEIHKLITHFNCPFKGYSELMEGPWKEDLSWMILEGKHSIPWTGLFVCNHNWEIVSCNDMFTLLTGFDMLDLMKGMTWCSLLPISSDFLKTVFDTVMMSASIINTTLTLVSKSGGLLKMTVVIRRFSEGYYITIEKNDSRANAAYLYIDNNEFIVPCIESSNSTLTQACHNLSQQLQLLLDYGIMKQQRIENNISMNQMVPNQNNNAWNIEPIHQMFNF